MSARPSRRGRATGKAVDVEFSFQWLRDGEPIAGAVTRDYRIGAADVGTALSVRVTASRPGEVNPGTADSDELIVKRDPASW